MKRIELLAHFSFRQTGLLGREIMLPYASMTFATKSVGSRHHAGRTKVAGKFRDALIKGVFPRTRGPCMYRYPLRRETEELFRRLRHGRGMMVENEPVLGVLYVSEAVAPADYTIS